MLMLCLPRSSSLLAQCRTPLSGALLGLLGLLAVQPASAMAANRTPPVPVLESAAESAAEPTKVPAAANWASILAQTETRLSQQLITEADVTLARAELARAKGWLAGAPIIDGLYRSDQPMSNFGAVEMQTDVRLPLRHFGQTQAWQTLAREAMLNGQTRATANRLALLGNLRQLAWDWRRAEAEWTAAQIRLDLMTRDLKAVSLQVKQGEAAEVDRLSVESRLLAVQDQLAAAQMLRDNAQARWRHLTGADALPRDLGTDTAELLQQLNNPSFDTPEGLLAEQPLLKQMASEVGLTTARIAAERAAGAGAPELGIGVKRDRGDRGMPYDNSLFVTLSLPIGGQKYRDPALAAMTQQRAAAQVALIKTTQQLIGEVAALRQRINAWPLRLSRLDASAALAEKTLKLKQKARQMGELDWSQVLSFERDAAEARLQAKLGHIEYEADISSLKQTLGLMPQN